MRRNLMNASLELLEDRLAAGLIAGPGTWPMATSASAISFMQDTSEPSVNHNSIPISEKDPILTNAEFHANLERLWADEQNLNSMASTPQSNVAPSSTEGTQAVLQESVGNTFSFANAPTLPPNHVPKVLANSAPSPTAPSFTGQYPHGGQAAPQGGQGVPKGGQGALFGAAINSPTPPGDPGCTIELDDDGGGVDSPPGFRYVIEHGIRELTEEFSGYGEDLWWFGGPDAAELLH